MATPPKTQPQQPPAAPRPQASQEVLDAAKQTAGQATPAVAQVSEAEIRARVEAEVRQRIEAEVRAEIKATLPKELDEVGGQKMRDMDKALREASAAASLQADETARARVVLQKGKKPPAGFVAFVTRRAMDVDAQHVPGYSGEGRSVTIGAGVLIQLPEATALSLEANGAGQIVS
jgi:hypothetical protein